MHQKRENRVASFLLYAQVYVLCGQIHVFLPLFVREILQDATIRLNLLPLFLSGAQKCLTGRNPGAIMCLTTS